MLIIKCRLSRTKAYDAWKMGMAEWEKSDVRRTHTHLAMPYLRYRSEKDYLLTLERIRGDLDGDRTMRPTIMVYCCPDAPYNTLWFLW